MDYQAPAAGAGGRGCYNCKSTSGSAPVRAQYPLATLNSSHPRVSQPRQKPSTRTWFLCVDRIPSSSIT
ncbi:hypothetical protein IQ07DRAFT_582861 [Pyrenochaeta sp. DS3sAY3a]|nr:hypothetical protein IQ07DRAFT_582861 [Pyrenochaeta sp. DS3sAY3a]